MQLIVIVRKERDLATQHDVTEMNPAGPYPGVGRFTVQMGALLTMLGTLLDDAFVTALGIGALTFAAVAWVWTRLSFTGLTVRRRLSERRAFPGETVTLTLEVENHKPLPQSWLHVADTILGQITVDGVTVPVDPTTHQGRFVTLWQPAPYQTQRQHYTIRCDHRGVHTFGPAEITTGDGLGFFHLFPGS